MKVRQTVSVGPYARYVIARYFGDRRPRATRAQVRRFVEGAVVSALREQCGALPGRQRATARRLQDTESAAGPPALPLREPDEKQLDLLTGGH